MWGHKQFQDAKGDVDQGGNKDPVDRQHRANKELGKDQQIQNVLVVQREAARGTQDAAIHADVDREADEDAHQIDLATPIEDKTHGDHSPDREGGIQNLFIGTKQADGGDEHENRA